MIDKAAPIYSVQRTQTCKGCRFWHNPNDCEYGECRRYNRNFGDMHKDSPHTKWRCGEFKAALGEEGEDGQT